MNVPAKGGNSQQKFAELMDIAKQLGSLEGDGKDAQIKFDLKVMEAGFLGSVDLSPDKHGEGLRDGKLLAEAYYKARTGVRTFDHKSPNQRKLISTVDLMIRLGMTSKWGPNEPVSVVNHMLNMRDKLFKAGDKVEDAHNTLMRFARKILRMDVLPNDDQIKDMVLRKQPEKITAEDVFERIKKLAEDLRAGDVTNSDDQDNSVELDRIIKNATKRLQQIAKLRAAQENLQPGEGDDAEDAGEEQGEGTTPTKAPFSDNLVTQPTA